MQQEYSAGDLIFAKVPGYPAWPARINKLPEGTVIPPGKFPIFFYGTHETAFLAPKDICPYEEFKELFGKPLKRPWFNVGLHELANNRYVLFDGHEDADKSAGPTAADESDGATTYTQEDTDKSAGPTAADESDGATSKLSLKPKVQRRHSSPAVNVMQKRKWKDSEEPGESWTGTDEDGSGKPAFKKFKPCDDDGNDDDVFDVFEELKMEKVRKTYCVRLTYRRAASTTS